MAVTAQKKRDIFSAAMIATLILCAMMARAVTQGQREAAWFLPVSLLRSFIYIGLMTWWSVSIRRRIVQTQARRYLMTIAALCVFWLSIRTVKFFFAVTPDASCQGLFYQIQKEVTFCAPPRGAGAEFCPARFLLPSR